MKPLRLAGFRTRRFPAWLQTFNVLCGAAAAAILGFGIYLLATRDSARDAKGVLVRPPGGGEPRVDLAVLERRLAVPAGGSVLGEALVGLEEPAVLRVLDAAAATCLPAAVSLESVLAGQPGKVGEVAKAELTASVGLESSQVPLSELRERAQTALAQANPTALTIYLAARGVVRGNPARRRAAVERLATLRDSHAVPLLLLALGTPEAELATQRLAEKALVPYAVATKPGNEGTPEERWIAWWMEAGRSVVPPLPYSLKLLTEPLEKTLLSTSPEEARHEAARNLGMLRDVNAREGIAALLSSASDPMTRADCAWALGRLGGAGAVDPLVAALKDPSPTVRIAAARAIGRGRFEQARLELKRLLDDPDEKLRIAGALGLLGFGDRSALAEIDVAAFDDRRTPAERLSVLEALDSTGDGAAASSRWIVALSDPDASVHEAAQVSLSRFVDDDKVLVGRPAWEKWWHQRFSDVAIAIPRGLGD